jgi:putative FmdB family regulatory protein
MPNFNYTCSKCGFTKEYLVSTTIENAIAPIQCPECEEIYCMEKQFSVAGITGEVVGGYEYEYGKKSWKRTASTADQAAILAGTKDPY